MKIFINTFIFVVVFSAAASALELKSDAFSDEGYIPARNTCDGANASPPLSWTDVPFNTQTFVIICYDDSAGYEDWVCWLIFNIPVETRELSEDQPRQTRFPNDMMQGINDYGNIGYNGPCPLPDKAHKYVFTLYALDTTLQLPSEYSKLEIRKAMKGHILAEAKLTGLYKRAIKAAADNN